MNALLPPGRAVRRLEIRALGILNMVVNIIVIASLVCKSGVQECHDIILFGMHILEMLVVILHIGFLILASVDMWTKGRTTWTYSLFAVWILYIIFLIIFQRVEFILVVFTLPKYIIDAADFAMGAPKRRNRAISNIVETKEEEDVPLQIEEDSEPEPQPSGRRVRNRNVHYVQAPGRPKRDAKKKVCHCCN